MKRFVMIVLLCVAAAPALASHGGDPRPLTGPEIWALLAGNNAQGHFTKSAGRWHERTTKDGRVLNLLMGSKLVGSWAVNEDRACYIYHGAEPHLICYNIFRSGTDYVFRDAVTGEDEAYATRISKPKR